MFDALYARGAVAREVSGPAWLQAMLDVEAALAAATAPPAVADAIASACRAEAFDLAALTRDAGEHASPVVPLVRALRDRVGRVAAPHVHAGATSQDVLDTALMLLARRALVPLLADAEAAADAAAALAREHRGTPVLARTLLQPALPTSFGLKAAGWMVALDEAAAVLRAAPLAVQMGGPVGHRDPAVAERVAAGLGLAVPLLGWAANRLRPVALAAGLGALAGALAKAARDVTLLAQGEVGEVREGGPGGRGASSAMAHKRNPVAAVSVLACAQRTPGLVAGMLAGMAQEHERGAGGWQAEWGTLGELLTLTGSATAWGRDLLEHLEPDPARMAANLAASGVHGDLGASGELVDRALAAREAAR